MIIIITKLKIKMKKINENYLNIILINSIL